MLNDGFIASSVDAAQVSFYAYARDMVPFCSLCLPSSAATAIRMFAQYGSETYSGRVAYSNSTRLTVGSADFMNTWFFRDQNATAVPFTYTLELVGLALATLDYSRRKRIKS